MRQCFLCAPRSAPTAYILTARHRAMTDSSLRRASLCCLSSTAICSSSIDESYLRRKQAKQTILQYNAMNVAENKRYRYRTGKVAADVREWRMRFDSLTEISRGTTITNMQRFLQKVAQYLCFFCPHCYTAFRVCGGSKGVCGIELMKPF